MLHLCTSLNSLTTLYRFGVLKYRFAGRRMHVKLLLRTEGWVGGKYDVLTMMGLTGDSKVPVTSQCHSFSHSTWGSQATSLFWGSIFPSVGAMEGNEKRDYERIMKIKCIKSKLNSWRSGGKSTHLIMMMTTPSDYLWEQYPYEFNSHVSSFMLC